jgi:hypothetical protein
MEGFFPFLTKTSISKCFRYRFDIVDRRLEDWKLEECETPKMMSTEAASNQLGIKDSFGFWPTAS